MSLPLARPAIAAGTALALMETLADFGTVSYFAVPTFTTGIFRAWFSLGDRRRGASLPWSARLRRGRACARARRARRALYHDRGPHAAAHAGATCAERAAALAIPRARAGARGTSWFRRPSCCASIGATGDPQFGARFLGLVCEQLHARRRYRGVAVAIALLLAYAARLTRGAVARGATGSPGSATRSPGAVIAIGVLIPVAALDDAGRWLKDASESRRAAAHRQHRRARLRLPRALPRRGAADGRGRPRADHAEHGGRRALARHGPGATLGPRARADAASSLLTAALLVFVDVMKELPATFVMRPFNFDTLAVQAYNLAADERLAEASTASLAIVAVGLLPVIVLSRRLTRARRTGSGASRRLLQPGAIDDLLRAAGSCRWSPR